MVQTEQINDAAATAQDAPATLWKYGVWESYKSIAKAHGLTIPALKRHLQAAGWLSGTSPTEHALRERIAVVERMTGGRYGDNDRILWNVPKVVEYLTEHGHPPLDEDRARLHITHRHQAADRIQEAALEIGRLLGLTPRVDEDETAADVAAPGWLERAYGDEAGRARKLLEGHLRWFEFEGLMIVVTASQPDEFRATVSPGLTALYEAAARHPRLDRERFDYWRSVADNAVDWVTSRRLDP